MEAKNSTSVVKGGGEGGRQDSEGAAECYENKRIPLQNF